MSIGYLYVFLGEYLFRSSDLPLYVSLFASQNRRKNGKVEKERRCQPLLFLLPSHGYEDTYQLKVIKTEKAMTSGPPFALLSHHYHHQLSLRSSHIGCCTGFERWCHFLTLPDSEDRYVSLHPEWNSKRCGSWLDQVRGPTQRVEVKAEWSERQTVHSGPASPERWSPSSVVGWGQRLKPCPVTNSVLIGTYYLPDLISCKSGSFPHGAYNFHPICVYWVPTTYLAQRWLPGSQRQIQF